MPRERFWLGAIKYFRSWPSQVQHTKPHKRRLDDNTPKNCKPEAKSAVSNDPDKKLTTRTCKHAFAFVCADILPCHPQFALPPYVSIPLSMPLVFLTPHVPFELRFAVCLVF